MIRPVKSPEKKQAWAARVAQPQQPCPAAVRGRVRRATERGVRDTPRSTVILIVLRGLLRNGRMTRLYLWLVASLLVCMGPERLTRCRHCDFGTGSTLLRRHDLKFMRDTFFALLKVFKLVYLRSQVPHRGPPARTFREGVGLLGEDAQGEGGLRQVFLGKGVVFDVWHGGRVCYRWSPDVPYVSAACIEPRGCG